MQLPNFDIHTFILLAIVAIGGALWKIYTVIEKNIENRFQVIEKRFDSMEKIFMENREEIREIKLDIRQINNKLAEMDKQIAILQVNINHIYLPTRPTIFDESSKKEIQ